MEYMPFVGQSQGAVPKISVFSVVTKKDRAFPSLS